MNAPAKIEKPRAPRAKLSIATPKPEASETALATIARIMPSAPELVRLIDMLRAPENVRHTRIDEDVRALADDILAHGLLQSLIGYRGELKVMIVGGGRRYQALMLLWEDGHIDGDFLVPVLIRSIDEAVELSLAENLQQRTMSPVDEFFAFQALMDRGDTSPAELAKRFGFTERVVRQRLRLAQLATPVLDALAERRITLDAALTYAATQDRTLQAEIFRAETKRAKSYREAHRPNDIRHAIAMKGTKTDSPIFRFVGEDAYVARGGQFEDDLFNEVGKERSLANPGLLMEIARELIDMRYQKALPQWICDYAPTITGYLVATDLRVKSWGNTAPKPPAGFVQVEKYDAKPMWKTIRNNAIETHVLIGINDAGELAIWPRLVFVPKEQRDALDPPPGPARSVPVPTPEELARHDRIRGIGLWQKRLAVGPFAGTPLQGRAFWTTQSPRAVVQEGLNGWRIPLEVFVTDEEVAAQAEAAEARYDEELAQRAAVEAASRSAEEAQAAASQARADELLAMDPPAVALIDGEAWARNDAGAYAVIDDEEGGWCESWPGLLANFDPLDVTHTYATRAEYDAARAGAGA